MGASGNFGDQDKFNWNNQTFYLQEVQQQPREWNSWRILLASADGMPIKQLSIKTHHSSVANPNISWISDNGQSKLVVTLFLPLEGNSPPRGRTIAIHYRSFKKVVVLMG